MVIAIAWKEVKSIFGLVSNRLDLAKNRGDEDRGCVETRIQGSAFIKMSISF